MEKGKGFSKATPGRADGVIAVGGYIPYSAAYDHTVRHSIAQRTALGIIQVAVILRPDGRLVIKNADTGNLEGEMPAGTDPRFAAEYTAACLGGEYSD